MGIYDAFKDAISIAQKADNVELYKQLLDLSAQALDLQEENARLKEQVIELEKIQDISGRIVRHKESYLTLSGDTEVLMYCSKCWDVERMLVQLQCNNYNGSFCCPNCKMAGTYDENKDRHVMEELDQTMDSILQYGQNRNNFY